MTDPAPEEEKVFNEEKVYNNEQALHDENALNIEKPLNDGNALNEEKAVNDENAVNDEKTINDGNTVNEEHKKLKPEKKILSPEEKKALKAEKKALKKKLAEEKKIQLKHDHLSREIKFAQLTVKQHEKNWKKMLMKIALPRMKEDLKFAWNNFERVIDSKDFTISLLMNELDEAEEQYGMNLKGHSENIDKLINLFDDRLTALRKENERMIELMRLSAEKKNEEIRSTFAENELYLKTMLFGLEMARKEQEKFVRGEYLSKVDEETAKCNDIIQHLKAGLEKTCCDIWYSTKTFLKQYTADTAEKRKAYKVLAEQDAAVSELCAKQLIQLENMQEYLKRLKIKFSNTQEIQELKIGDLMQERQYFVDAFWTLKTRLENDRKLDDAILAVLTTKSNDITIHLQKILKKGRHLLELSAICRKFETEEEKILPFPMRITLEEYEYMENDIRLEEFRNVANLKFFWQRVAQADGIRYSINEEREFLRRENRKLKQKIHDYCECLDCPVFSTRDYQKQFIRK